MKILLTAINAKYIHSNPAVYSLKKNASNYAPMVEIAEFTINHLREDILRSLYERKPDVLMFSVYIWNLEYVSWLIREFHKICPDVPICLGGPEVSYDALKVLEQFPEVLLVMKGEGEATFYETLDYFHGQRSLDEILGITYRLDGKVIDNLNRRPLDFDSVSFAYDEKDDFTNKIVYYESQRGCPFSCSYCLSGIDRGLRVRSLSKVFDELNFFLDRKVAQVKFVDRTFNANKEHALAILQYIYEHDNGITNFHFEVAADLITKEELAILKKLRPGLVQLEIGVQSTNLETIQEIRRKMDLKRVYETVLTLLGYQNMHVHLDLIAGLPYEDYKTFTKSFNDVYALKPSQLQLGFPKVLKGSYMHEMRSSYELVYEDTPPYEVLSTKWLSYDEILKLKLAEEMLEVYYNRGQYSMAIRVLETQFSDAFSMFLSLGEYYLQENLLNIAHSRLKRAEILLSFAEKIGMSGAKFDCIREAIVYDIYARENSKTRPLFADDSALWKDVSKKAANKGKLSHVERFFFRFLDIADTTLSSLPEKEETPVYILFDYEKKNPISMNASSEYVI